MGITPSIPDICWSNASAMANVAPPEGAVRVVDTDDYVG